MKKQTIDINHLLRPFRALEEDGDAVVVLGDEDAMRVLASARKVEQSWMPPRRRMPPWVDADDVDRAAKSIEVASTFSRQPDAEAVRLISECRRRAVAVWSWMREGWIIDADAIAQATGLTVYVVRIKLNVLISARIIYPDGNPSKAARAALQLHVAQKLGIKPRRKKDPDGAKPDGSGNTN